MKRLNKALAFVVMLSFVLALIPKVEFVFSAEESPIVKNNVNITVPTIGHKIPVAEFVRYPETTEGTIEVGFAIEWQVSDNGVQYEYVYPYPVPSDVEEKSFEEGKYYRATVYRDGRGSGPRDFADDCEYSINGVSYDMATFIETMERLDTAVSNDTWIVHFPKDWTGYTPISTPAELNAIRNKLSGKYYLTNDIVFTEADFAEGGAFYNEGAGWAPIGTNSNKSFTGIFDGNGYTIKNLYINISGSSTVYAGLFGYSKGTIKNLGIIEGTINVDSHPSYVGGIVGSSSGTVTNCYNTGTVEGRNHAGGIVGYLSSSGIVTNCYNTGTVDGYDYAGGIVGSLSSAGSVANCYNTGSVDGYNVIGGIVGYSSGTVTNCYYLDNQLKGVGSGTDTCSKCTAEQMMQQTTFAGFDFDDVWTMAGLEKYLFPELQSVQLVVRPDNTTEFAGGAGFFGDPYLIQTKQQLNNVRNYLGASFKLLNDIEFTEADFAEGGAFYNEGTGWAPIGTNSYNSFTGIFDGNGYAIKNLYVNISGSSNVYAGLFGYSKGTIKNLGMIDGEIAVETTSDYAYAYAGGIVGYLSSGAVTNCYNTGSVAGYDVGGIVGSSSSTVTDCYNTGTVDGSSYAGGIVGDLSSSGTVTNCYNTGSVAGYDAVGGIVGDSGGTVTNCYNMGTVEGSYAVGGIAGDSYGTVTNCYNTGIVDGSSYAGGIVGYLYSSVTATVNNCYYLDNELKGVGSGTDTCIKCTAEQMRQQSTFAGFDFDTIWTMAGLEEYPFPELQPVPMVALPDSTTEFAGGAGFVWDPYLIQTKQQLNNVRNYLGASFKMLNDIEFTEADFAEGGAFYNEGAGWAPIGTNSDNPFTGTFDGNGCAIRNLYINISGSSTVYAGLFGYSTGAIKNLGMIEGTINVETTSGTSYAGGIVGYSYSGTVSNCYNTGTVGSSYAAGGISGYLRGTVTNCYNTGNVEGHYAGGIVGYDSFIAVSNCYNAGNVEGSFVGGIVGGLSLSGTVTNCYNTGTVDGSSYAGGIVGDSYGTVTNCYNAGNVEGSSYVGEITGRLVGSVTNCYYITDKGGFVITDTTVKQYTLEQMMQQTTFADFDFDTVWTIGGLAEYPFPELQSVPMVDLPGNTTEFAGGAGFFWDPYLIQTKQQLNNVRNYLGASFKLLNDIEFTETDFAEGGAFYNDGAGWAPIGTDADNSFTGTFDGNGYAIKNLYVNVSGSSDVYAGLFGYGKGTIKNLGMIDGEISAETTSDYANAYAGGIVGYLSSGTVTNCYNTGGVSSTSKSNSSSFSGGIVGYTYTVTVTNCYNTGTVESNDWAGGIAGYACFGTMTNCYNTGNVAGYVAGRYAGGIVGCSDSGTVSNCYYLDNEPQGVGSGRDTCTKCTAEQMMQQTTFADFDFDTVWTMAGDADYLYPELQGVEMQFTKELESIAVTTNPIKTNYLETKDNLDLSGGKLSLIYNNGETEEVDLTDVTITGFDNTKVGEQTLTVTYEGKICEFEVEVIAKSLVSIAVTSAPSKTDYLESKDALNLAGGKLTLTYDNDTTEEIDLSKTTVTGFDNTKVGEQTLTVTYNGKTTTFKVKIIAKALTSIAITTKPSKLTYLEGESFDKSGMVVTAYYNNNTSAVITDYTVSGYSSTVGTKTVTVSYGGKTATFTVTVKSRVPSSITSSKFTVSGGNISKIPAGTTVSALLAGINEGAYCKVYKGNSEVSGSAVVGTGMVVKIMDGNTVKASYTVIVTGDTNGDGNITVTDMIAIKAHILKKTLLSGAAAKAADTNGDNSISITDFIQVKAKILGKGTITAR